MNNSETTLVKYVFLSMSMSQTRYKITFLIDKLLNTHCEITLLTNRQWKTRKVTFLKSKIAETRRTGAVL